jgi:anaerobic magnesium-protoporphyrin IX monomethyl ester cyclase
LNLDVLFINPGNAKEIYQDLSKDFSAIEPPTWALLLAQSIRSVGFSAGILDVNAERLDTKSAIARLINSKVRLFCFVVYGQNPNSGTVNMSGAVKLANAIKDSGIEIPICFVGSHMSALPTQVLDNEKSIDIVLCNEGVYALRNLLSVDIKNDIELKEVKGIGFRLNGKVHLTPPELIVPQERMDIDLPGYAWDLLPYKNNPLDLYRSHFWHAGYNHENRTPFAAIYTSLGCLFKCDFCMINILNRDDEEEIGDAADYAKMRFWSPNFIIKEFDKLVQMGVKTLRISDEMFLLNKKYFVPLCEILRDKGYGKILNMWAYSRVDTVRNPEHLELIKSAGINWLALGIESGERSVRLQASKGKFEDIDIAEVIKRIHDADIEIIANYLFGLAGDNMESMQKTLDLGLELNTSAWNAYAVMPLPGSALFKQAFEDGYSLPKSYEEYSFFSANTSPLPTEYLTSAEILRFRDEAFQTYHSNPNFLNRIRKKYGEKQVGNVQELTKIKLKRNIILEDK